MRLSSRTVFTACATAIVAAAIVAGLVINGSPAEVRKQRLDEQRVDDLRSLSLEINSYYRKQKKLPEMTTDLIGTENYFSRTRLSDPVSGKLYDYRVAGEASYELCATFESSSAGDNKLVAFVAPRRTDGEDPAAQATPAPFGAFWAHGTGNHCFELKA